MGIPETLAGTEPFSLEELSANYNFSDHYAKQWMKTLEWMKQDLQEKSAQRDQERRSDSKWLTAQRKTLNELTGASKFEAKLSDVKLQPLDQFKATYLITLENGLQFAGTLILPDDSRIGGIVVLADSDKEWKIDHNVISSYLTAGIGVIQPFFAKKSGNFKEHPIRKKYNHSDELIIQNLAFICGGSLAGMEAVELHITTAALLNILNLNGKDVPVVVDLRGRYLLSGMIASALYPDWATIVSVHSHADILNHQENDAITNTIWKFHKHFDLLSLIQLAETSHFVCIYQCPTPAAWFSQAVAWFDQQENEQNSRHIVICSSEESTQRICSLFGILNRIILNFNVYITQGDNDNQESLDVTLLYKKALNSKADFLDREQDKAKHRIALRYDINSISIDDYKKRIEQSMRSVMGDPLLKSSEMHVRTKLVTDSSDQFTMYECLLESVKGIDVAGYLLIPKEARRCPAIICQHGVMGRPEVMIGKDEDYRYDRMAWTLAEKGYVVFVPFMNWGWGGSQARNVIAKHAYASGISCCQFEVTQLHTIMDFLQTRPEVIVEKIGFYGLSYGGYASIWLGACEPRLAAVVTAGHFNDWHKKLVSAEICPPFSGTHSYITIDNSLDMFNFDILNQLGHAELTTLHAPRPYMVENGLKDAVTPESWVEDEFAKVRKVYEYLNASDLAELTHFDGPHRFWGEESLIFLRKHLYDK